MKVDCHFRPIDAVVVSHHLIKDVEIGEAFSNLLNLAPRFAALTACTRYLDSAGISCLLYTSPSPRDA